MDIFWSLTSAIMALAVTVAIGLLAMYFGSGKISGSNIGQSLNGFIRTPIGVAG